MSHELKDISPGDWGSAATFLRDTLGIPLRPYIHAAVATAMTAQDEIELRQRLNAATRAGCEMAAMLDAAGCLSHASLDTRHWAAAHERQDRERAVTTEREPAPGQVTPPQPFCAICRKPAASNGSLIYIGAPVGLAHMNCLVEDWLRLTDAAHPI